MRVRVHVRVCVCIRTHKTRTHTQHTHTQTHRRANRSLPAARDHTAVHRQLRLARRHQRGAHAHGCGARKDAP